MAYFGILKISAPGVLSVLFNVILISIVVNNLLYQTDYQLNQPIFVIAILLLLLFYVVVERGCANKWYYILFLSLIIYSVWSVFFHSSDLTYTNRAIFNFAAAASYLVIFFFLSKKDLPNLYLYIFLALFIAGAFYILAASDRDLFNPNWYAMTMFYLFALSSHRERKWLVLVFALICFGLYESRGAFVSFFAAFFVSSMLSFVKQRRGITLVSFLFATLAMFYFVHHLYEDQDLALLVINDIVGKERSIGGREGALIEGYSQLIKSNYLGGGIGASTSFVIQDNIGVYKDVHIHFGLLDIFIKFGFIGVVFAYFLASRVIQKGAESYSPYVLGGLMTVLYYNGLATSHLGLNLLLYLLLGQALNRSRGRGSSAIINSTRRKEKLRMEHLGQ